MQHSNKWVIDPSHTKVGFSVRHFGISETDGMFRKYDVKVSAENNDFSDLQLEAIIQTNSVDTNDADRDKHLLADDFFNSAVYPELRFKSTQVEATSSANVYKLHGELTIRNVTKPVIMDLEYLGTVPQDPFGNTKAGFHLRGSINRQEFGLNFNVMLGTGNLAVSDKVNINIPVQLLKRN